MKRQKFYWALGVLVMLFMVWFFYNVGPPLDTEQPPGSLPKPEQVAAPPILKAPPQGETFATGHWEGDQWQRTVPEAPATVMHDGKAMPLDKFYSYAYRVRSKNWAEGVALLNRAIAADPYSKSAYYTRRGIAMRDENGEWIYNDAVLFDRLQPLLAYHPDSPGLLGELLGAGMHIYPEAAIHYGTEALKYVDMYRMNSGYGAYPERIHHYLGFAYQNIGDYSKALEHHRQSLKLIESYPDRAYMQPDTPRNSINRILSGKPGFGPLAQKVRSKAVGGLPVAPSVGSASVSVPRELPSVEPGDPLFDGGADADDDVPGASPSDGVDPRAVARQQAQKMSEHTRQKTQAEQKRFENFVKQLHQIATIKTEADFEKYLTQELVKQLEGSKPAAAPVKRPSAERMRRASQIFRNAKTPAEGMKKLREVDPDFANTLRVR